uniref:Uncharacterized protein n=1 Tax=viral metagenome TaxID=1070528 RepID=A0A6M3KG43_9ZZZZ
MGTKLNPGAYDCLDKIAPDEPFFVLRAKDPLAADLVADWVDRASRTLLHEPDKLMEASMCADAMRDWRDMKRVQDEAIADQEKLFALEGSLRLFAGGRIEYADHAFRFVRTDGEGVVTSVSLRGLIEKMPKDDIPF